MKKFRLWNKNRPLSQNIVFTMMFFLLVLYSATVLFFFVYGFLIALRPDMKTFTMDRLAKRLFTLPDKPTLMNFVRALDEIGRIDGTSTFLSLTWNSIWRTVINTILGTFSQAMVCYVLVFYRCKYTRFVYNWGLIITMLPLYGVQGATYKLFMDLHLINNPLNFITAIALYGGQFFYMYSFFKALSWEYAEAAFIDGAGHYTVFFKVMLPMVMPSLSALFIMNFIGGWNDYESTLLYMYKWPNLSYAIYAYEEIGKYSGNIPAYMAGILVALLPILILYLCFQNTIMSKVYLGGLKG